ncbi:MAG: dihydroorotate dehydrogenase electron transfer subunit [Burkholderiales bacterium]|nr:dihydroorotate dehydrogenase electron transfer subunit [Phycisphaerae bacterium]
MDRSPRGQYLTTVRANVPLCREHFRLTLLVEDFPVSEPGQFIQIACVGPDDNGPVDHVIEWSPGERPILEGAELSAAMTMLRRPFSLAGRRETIAGTELDIIGRDVGLGTRWMSQLAPGDVVNIIGPLGNAFELPPKDGIALMVGGGVGIPPMIYLAEKLAQFGRKGVAFCGATTLDLLSLTINDASMSLRSSDVATTPQLNVVEFAAHGIPAIITTDDGSYGAKGYVTGALEQYLDASLPDGTGRAGAVIYTCGPELMMKRVAQIALSRSIACQICVERAMACGMGTCQSCCIKVKKDDPQLPPLAGKDWCYRLACTDGPVFAAEKLLW